MEKGHTDLSCKVYSFASFLKVCVKVSVCKSISAQGMWRPIRVCQKECLCVNPCVEGGCVQKCAYVYAVWYNYLTGICFSKPGRRRSCPERRFQILVVTFFTFCKLMSCPQRGFKRMSKQCYLLPYFSNNTCRYRYPPKKGFQTRVHAVSLRFSQCNLQT